MSNNFTPIPIQGTPATPANRSKALKRLVEVATKAATWEFNVRVQVRVCCNLGVKRRDVLLVLKHAGWSLSRARQIVSIVYIQQGQRMRKPGAGRRTNGSAKRIMNYAVKFCGTRKAAIPTLLAAYRHLRNTTTRLNK